MVIDGPKIPLRRKCKTNQQKCFAHIWDSIYIKRQINYCLKSYKNRLKTDVLRRFLVRVGRLELPASCSQMCVWTFNWHSCTLFGAFLCFGSSSLTLFRPACFKKTFRLLGFVWDWILCIKRCSVRFEGGDDRTDHLRAEAQEMRRINKEWHLWPLCSLSQSYETFEN